MQPPTLDMLLSAFRAYNATMWPLLVADYLLLLAAVYLALRPREGAGRRRLAHQHLRHPAVAGGGPLPARAAAPHRDLESSRSVAYGDPGAVPAFARTISGSPGEPLRLGSKKAPGTVRPGRLRAPVSGVLRS